MEQQH